MVLYIICVVLVQFVLTKLFWKKLRYRMDDSYNNVWLEYKEGWIVVFGGLLFPITILMGGLNYLWNILEVDKMLDGKEDDNN